jgi:hypothetical protein
MTSIPFSRDTRAFISLLARHRVRYVIVGGEAVIYHGFVRYTGDIDFFYERTKANAARMYRALRDFWGGAIPGLTNRRELLELNRAFLFGAPPHRIDILNSISGVSFREAWRGRIVERISLQDSEVEIAFLGLEELIKNKKCIGRMKDREDLKYLLAARTRKRKHESR